MQVIIALGANLGNPQETLRAAALDIAALKGISVLAASSLYCTTPVGYAAQDDFINAVMAVESSLEPLELLQQLAALEQKYKRVRTIKNGPRTLDLDVITCGDIISADPVLTLPHPRAQERAFVLVPLAEITPDLIFPDTKRSVQSLVAELSAADVAGVRLMNAKLMAP